jgi:hypothetical protein
MKRFNVTCGHFVLLRLVVSTSKDHEVAVSRHGDTPASTKRAELAGTSYTTPVNVNNLSQVVRASMQVPDNSMEDGVGKYDPLRDHLAARSRHINTLKMSFDELEVLVGPLPRSARARQAWWSNNADTRGEVRAWRAAGWHVQSADRSAEQVVFARDDTDVMTTVTPEPTLTGSGGQGHENNQSPGNPAESETAPREKRSGLRNLLPEWIMTRDLAVGVVAAALAGVTGLVGFTHLPWYALLFLSVTVGAAAFTITKAIESGKDAQKESEKDAQKSLQWWSISTVILLVAVSGAFAYHKLWDPATHGHGTYEFVANGTEVDVIPLYGEAGGPEQLLATGAAGQNGLVGGQSYQFDCWTVGLDGQEWLRYERFGQSWWAPRKYLHPPFGESEPPVPHC